MIAYLPTATAICPACHNGPCNDGTLCDSSRRSSGWGWVEIGPALRELPFGATVREMAEYSRHPRHQNRPAALATARHQEGETMKTIEEAAVEKVARAINRASFNFHNMEPGEEERMWKETQIVRMAQGRAAIEAIREMQD